MILEKIKIEFTKEIETIIDQKRQEINKLSGLEKAKAQDKHLDNFNNFAGQMNKIINEIIQKNADEFQSEDDFNMLSDYIKPTFDQLHTKYIQLGYPY